MKLSNGKSIQGAGEICYEIPQGGGGVGEERAK